MVFSGMHYFLALTRLRKKDSTILGERDFRLPRDINYKAMNAVCKKFGCKQRDV